MHPSVRKEPGMGWIEGQGEGTQHKSRGDLTLFNGSPSLTGTREHMRAISKWTQSRATRRPRSIWKITFASGAQITNNLFIVSSAPLSLPPVASKCASTKLRERWANLEDKENIIKSIAVK